MCSHAKHISLGSIGRGDLPLMPTFNCSMLATKDRGVGNHFNRTATVYIAYW